MISPLLTWFIAVVLINPVTGLSPAHWAYNALLANPLLTGYPLFPRTVCPGWKVLTISVKADA